MRCLHAHFVHAVHGVPQPRFVRHNAQLVPPGPSHPTRCFLVERVQASHERVCAPLGGGGGGIAGVSAWRACRFPNKSPPPPPARTHTRTHHTTHALAHPSTRSPARATSKPFPALSAVQVTFTRNAATAGLGGTMLATDSTMRLNRVSCFIPAAAECGMTGCASTLLGQPAQASEAHQGCRSWCEVHMRMHTCGTVAAGLRRVRLQRASPTQAQWPAPSCHR
jgi:hypothetical protein